MRQERACHLLEWLQRKAAGNTATSQVGGKSDVPQVKGRKCFRKESEQGNQASLTCRNDSPDFLHVESNT